MKNYNRDKIDKMLQPLMTMMQEEFPNNCKLIIEPHFARIVYNHEEMIFQSDEMKKPLGKTFVGEGIKNFIQTMANEDCKYYIPDADIDHNEYPNEIEVDGLCDNCLKYTDEMCFCSYGGKER